MADETLPAPARRAAEAAYRNWRIGDDGEGRLHAALVAYAAAGQEGTEEPHRPGPRRMASRDLAPADCLSCGQRWPCEGSWRARAERAEARLATLAEHRNAACAALRTAETVARHVAGGDAAADRYRAAREALEGDGGEGPDRG